MNRGLLLILCCAIYVLGMFHRSSPAVLAQDIMTAFEVSAAGFGLVGGSTMLALGLLQLPSGVLSDAFGSRRVIFWFTLLAAAGSLGFALSPSLNAALASRFLVGVGIAISVPIFSLLAESFSAQTYGRALSVITASGSLGVMLAAPPLVLLNNSLGWRMAVAVFAVITLGAALVFRMATREPQLQSIRRRPDPAAMLAGVVQVFRTPAFWPLCLWQLSMMGSFFMLLSLWWVPYLTDTAGCTPLQASSLLVVASLCIICLQPVTAWLSDSWFQARRKPLIVCSFFSLAAALMMVFATGRMGFAALVLHAVLLAGGVLASPLLLAMVKESFPPHLIGTALGCVNMFYPVWTAVLQIVFGVLINWRLQSAGVHAAYAGASMLLLFNAVVACLMGFLMKETFVARPAPVLLPASSPAEENA